MVSTETEATRALVLLHEADEDVDKVATVVDGFGVGGFEVLLDDLLKESIEFPEHMLTTGGYAGETVHKAAKDVRKIVLRAETRSCDHSLVYHIMEVLHVPELLCTIDVPKRDGAYNTIHIPEDVILQDHWFLSSDS